MRNIKLYTGIGFVLLLFNTSLAKAQDVENEFQTRTNITLKYSPIKKLKLSFSPEIRFDESFSPDVYLLEGKAKYKVFDFLSLGGTYRFAVNPRDSKDTEFINRYSLGAVVDKKIARFKPSFRLRYTNDADDAVSDEQFFRYKGLVEYNIKNCKASPFVAVEAFHQLQDNQLHKMRYSAGVDYKLNKKSAIDLSYKFDYFQTEYKNKHIITLGYKYKF